MEHGNKLVEIALARERREREVQEEILRRLWRQALLQVRVVRAFSDAGDRARSKRLRRTFRVAIFAVIASQTFLSFTRRASTSPKHPSANLDSPSKKSQATKKKWRLAALKLSAVHRFLTSSPSSSSSSPSHITTSLSSSSPTSSLFISAENEKRKEGLKRCEVCVLFKREQTSNKEAVKVWDNEATDSNAQVYQVDEDDEDFTDGTDDENESELDDLLANGSKLEYKIRQGADSFAASATQLWARAASSTDRRLKLSLSEDTIEPLESTEAVESPIDSKEAQMETNAEEEVSDEEDYDCEELMHLVADEHAEDQLDEDTFSQRWSELLFKVDDDQSQVSDNALNVQGEEDQEEEEEDRLNNDFCLSRSVTFEEVQDGTPSISTVSSECSSLGSSDVRSLRPFRQDSKRESSAPSRILKVFDTEDLDEEEFMSQLAASQTDLPKPILAKLSRGSTVSSVRARPASFKTTADDFVPLRIVGTGGSGQVYLVQHIESRKRFAMKVLNKAEVISEKKIDRVNTEREILTKANESPFITHLKFAFHSQDMLFFVMEYCTGGNLHEVMIREHEIRQQTMSREAYKTAMEAAAEGLGLVGALKYVDYFDKALANSKPKRTNANASKGKKLRRLDILRQFGLLESHVQFIIAEVIEGLLFLHHKGFVYRDLKPQNVMLNVDGHIRIGDFGVSKLGTYRNDIGRVELRSNSFVGTVEYMAPEVVSGEPQTCLVDNWSLGILLYELLFGAPPFFPSETDEDNRQLYMKILQPSKFLHFPPSSSVSAHAKDLIRQLLKRTATSRVTLSAMKSHAFFDGINWSCLDNSSGFHKLCPRIHLHRNIKRRPESMSMLPVSTPKNIFLASLEKAQSAQVPVVGSSLTESTSLVTKVQRSLSSSAISRIASFGSSSTPPLSTTDSSSPAISTSPCSLSPLSPPSQDTLTRLEPSSSASSTSSKGWRSRLKRFVSSISRKKSSRKSQKNEGNNSDIAYCGFTHSVEDAASADQLSRQRQGSFHSGRTRDDSASTQCISSSQTEPCFVGFEWKCDV